MGILNRIFKKNSKIDTVEQLIKSLADENPLVREKTVRALGELKDARAVGPLIEALEDENRYVRDEAASALGKLNDARAIEPFIKSLKDEYQSVQLKAASALGELKDARAVEPLIKALEDENEKPGVRAKAASALGELKDARAVEPLIEALLSYYNPAAVQESAARVLWELKDARTVEPFIKALEDDNPSVRKVAASALGDLKDARAVEPLIKVLHDPDETVRNIAKMALDKFDYSIAQIQEAIDALGGLSPPVWNEDASREARKESYNEAKQTIIRILKRDLNTAVKRYLVESYIYKLPFLADISHSKIYFDDCGYPYQAYHYSPRHEGYFEHFSSLLDLDFGPNNETLMRCPMCNKVVIETDNW